jgi:hypothetical protein
MALASTCQLTQDILNGIFGIRLFSDKDYKFIKMVLEAWLDYGLSNKVVYHPPTSDTDGVLPDFGDDEIVGILGDWGTNLPDAFDIMDELVLNRGVTVLLHDGDVYYAGFPN